MDGDISNLQQIRRIAKEQNAITVVDDAHGDFIFGEASASSLSRFSGIPSYLGVNNDIDVHTSQLKQRFRMLWWICCFNKTNKGTSCKQITTIYLHLCITRTLMRFCINCHPYSDKGKLTKKVI